MVISDYRRERSICFIPLRFNVCTIYISWVSPIEFLLMLHIQGCITS